MEVHPEEPTPGVGGLCNLTPPEDTDRELGQGARTKDQEERVKCRHIHSKVRHDENGVDLTRPMQLGPPPWAW